MAILGSDHQGGHTGVLVLSAQYDARLEQDESDLLVANWPFKEAAIKAVTTALS